MNDTHSARRVLTSLLVLPALLTALAACGEGGSSVPAPTISDLYLAPSAVSVGELDTLTGTLLVTDVEGDASELDGTITLPGGQAQALPPTPLQGASGLMAATVTFTLDLTPPVAGTYQVSVVVKDAEGQSSNTLTTTLDAM